jgi:sugar phosphate isomerase/epimerase
LNATPRLVSLAAGTVLDVDPPDAVTVAAAAGFGAAGIWFDPDSWTPATSVDVAERLDGTGLVALDVEPVILGRGVDHGDRIVDVAAELHARHVLVASGPAPIGAVIERVGALCDRAADSGVVVVLEFLPIFTVATLGDAVAVVEAVGQPNAAVLVDTLHLARSGGSPEDVRATPARLLPYLQVADAPAAPPGTSPDTLREEALHGRLPPGDGELPLRRTLDAAPDAALSLEIRSRRLMADHHDPTERARAVLAATRSLLTPSESQRR